MGAVERIVRVLYCSQGQAVHDHRFLRAIRDQGHEALQLRLGGEGANGAVLDRTQEIDEVRGAWPLVAPAQGLKIRNTVRTFSAGCYPRWSCSTCFVFGCVAGFPTARHNVLGIGHLVECPVRLRTDSPLNTPSRGSQAFLCDCEAVSSRALELGMDPHRILTFPWGVDLDHFSPRPSADLRRELGWQDNLVLISTRAWEPIYGSEILVRSFIEAAKEMPQTTAAAA